MNQEGLLGQRLPPRAKGRPRKGASQGGREGARSRSRSPQLRAEDEDRANIAFIQQQQQNPWHFRITIMGTVVAGPLRPTVAAAREDRTRLQREMAELKQQGKEGKELLQEMQAKAKVLKGEVKAEKHKEAYERQKAAKRASYAADWERTRSLASQESQSQEQREGGERSGIQEQARARGKAPRAAQGNPPPAGQKREAEDQDWDGQAEERRLRRVQAYEKKLANMRANYDATKRRSRHLAEQEAKKKASQSQEEGGEASQEGQGERAADQALDQTAVAGEREIAMGRGRGGGRNQQPEQVRQGRDPDEEKGQKGKKPQQKGELVPEPKRASRAGGKMAKGEVSERRDQAAPQDTAQGGVQQPKAKKRATESEEAAIPNRQQQPVEAGHCPGPKGRSSRKQRD